MEYEQSIDYQSITPFRTGNLRDADAEVPASFELEESRAYQRILDAHADDLVRRHATYIRYSRAIAEAESRGEEVRALRYSQRIARVILRETTGSNVLMTRLVFDDIVYAEEF